MYITKLINYSLQSIPVYVNAVDLGHNVSINCSRQLLLRRQLGDVQHANIR